MLRSFSFSTNLTAECVGMYIDSSWKRPRLGGSKTPIKKGRVWNDLQKILFFSIIQLPSMQNSLHFSKLGVPISFRKWIQSTFNLHFICSNERHISAEKRRVIPVLELLHYFLFNFSLFFLLYLYFYQILSLRDVQVFAKR